ncbi:hypothetical protein TWF481_001946 [Arthrobotrys musiformis]|uniref:Uncharacterized protein n=1 Tax=Arthrobotrys musiformis TaxID=47236 RepID=A0AAV9VW45_9PEZI
MPVTIGQSETEDHQLHRDYTAGAPTTRSHHSGVSLNPFQRRPLAAGFANRESRASARAKITVSYNDEDDTPTNLNSAEVLQPVMTDHQTTGKIVDYEQQHEIPSVAQGKSAEVIYTPPSTASEEDEEETTTTIGPSRAAPYPYATFGQTSQEKFYPKKQEEHQEEEDSESDAGRMMSSDNVSMSEVTSDARPRRGYRRTSNDQTRRELRQLMGQTLKEMEEKLRHLEMARAKQDQEIAVMEVRHQKEQDDLLLRLSTKHHEETQKLREEHAKQMVNAKKEGATAELVQGLHKSYGQQLENLILEIGDVKRLNELLQERLNVAEHEEQERAASVQETVRPVSRHSTIPTVLEEHRSPPGYLQVSLQFVSFNNAYDVPSIRIPHPGASYTALSKSVRCAIGNYLAFLRSKDSIHSSSVDSAQTYRLSLNLDSCTRLLFFGKGDLNGEEITEDKWLSRFNKTDDLIACVYPPPQHRGKPSSINVSQIPESHTQASNYEDPPPTASTVRTSRSSAIWGRQPSSASVTSSLLRRSHSYSMSSARPATSDIAEEESVSTESPPRGRSRVRSPEYVPASETDEPTVPYFDAAKELEMINDQLSQMDGSRATVKTASLIDKEDNMTRVSGHASGIYTTRQGSSASVIAAYARVRQPLLRTNATNEEGLEIEDLRNDVEDDDERGEGVELEAGSVLNAMSPHLVPDTRDLRDVQEVPGIHASPVDSRNHQYEMVGSGIDTLRVDESTEDEEEDEDESKEMMVGDKREFESLLENEKAPPLYLDEFLMPLEKEKDARARSQSPAFPSPNQVKAHLTGTKSVYQPLEEMQSPVTNPPEQTEQQKSQDAIHTVLKELKTGPSGTTENPLLQALARSINVDVLRRALDETPAGREILLSATPVPHPVSNRVMEEPKIIPMPESENVPYDKTGSSRSRSNNPWSHSRPAEVPPRTTEHPHPLVDISGNSPPHPTPPPLVEPKAPKFGIYGFVKPDAPLPGRSPISTPSIISREENNEAKKLWMKQTLVTSAPLSRVSSPTSTEASWGAGKQPRSLTLEDDDATTTAPRGRARLLELDDEPPFYTRGSRGSVPSEQYPSPYINSGSARGSTFAAPPPPPHPFPTLEETYSLRDDGSVRSQYREPSLASSNPFSNKMYMTHHHSQVPPPPPPPSSSTRRSQQIPVYPTREQIQRVTESLREVGLNPQDFSATFYAEFASATPEMQKEAIDNIVLHQAQRKRVEQVQQVQQAQQQQQQAGSQVGSGSQSGNGGWGFTNGVPPPPLPMGFYTGQTNTRHGHGYGSMSSRGSGQTGGASGYPGSGYPWQ